MGFRFRRSIRPTPAVGLNVGLKSQRITASLLVLPAPASLDQVTARWRKRHSGLRAPARRDGAFISLGLIIGH
jgi:hypothetical protein